MHLDGQVATPASVSSTDASSQQAACDGTSSSTPNANATAAPSGLSTKMEVKTQDEDEDDEDDESSTGGRIGKLSNIKTEEKPDVSIPFAFSVY